MKRIFLMIFTVWTTILFGQTYKKGIYRGQKTPFLICYLTYTDSTIEVEYFNQKSGQIFGHFPAKKLKFNMESFGTKPVFKSVDDSVMVYGGADYFLIKRKGFSNIKAYKSTDNQQEIRTLRNRNRLFSFSNNLYNEFKTKSNFEQEQFWKKFNSYGLDKQVNLEEIEFNKKLDDTRNEIKKNWL